MDTIGKKIKKLRKQYGLTQRGLAKETGINFNTLLKIEQDKITNPTINTLQLISDGLGIDYGFWFNGNGNIKIENSYLNISDENFTDLLEVARELKNEDDLLGIKIGGIEIICSDAIDNDTVVFINKETGKEIGRMLV